MEPVTGTAGIAVQNQFRDCRPALPVLYPAWASRVTAICIAANEICVASLMNTVIYSLPRIFFSPFRIVQTTDHNGGPIIKNNREFALLETADAGRQVADKIGFERIAPQ